MVSGYEARGLLSMLPVAGSLPTLSHGTVSRPGRADLERRASEVRKCLTRHSRSGTGWIMAYHTATWARGVPLPSLTAIAFGKYTVAEQVAAANWAGLSREGRGVRLQSRLNR